MNSLSSQTTENKPAAGDMHAHKPPTNLQIRTITSLVALPLVLVVIFAGGVVFAAVIWAFFFIAALEYQAMASQGKITPSALIHAGLALLLSVMITFSIQWTPVVVVLSVVLIWIAPRLQPDQPVNALSDRVLGWILAVYVGCIAGFAVLLRWDSAGLLWYVLIASGTWSMDVMSYVGGKLLGKHLLSPKLSPKKTIEGAVIGAFSAILISFLLVLQMGALMPLTVFLLLINPSAALAGDLLESAVKRHFHTKDSLIHGLNILPGHGGVLDRIDSLMVVIGVCFVCVALFR
ncbi:MAG: phosphatidate cytidylyltransferase [Anaerolineae bacterium]